MSDKAAGWSSIRQRETRQHTGQCLLTMRREPSGIGGVKPGLAIESTRIPPDACLPSESITRGGRRCRDSIERTLYGQSGVPRTSGGRSRALVARPTIARNGGGGGRTRQKAVTHWKRLDALREAALVECRLETGRTHQVRVHMASIGHPLLGDPFYGGSGKMHRKLLNKLNFRRQALHAATLGFIHPVTKRHLSFESRMPADMQELFSALGVYELKR